MFSQLSPLSHQVSWWHWD